MPSRVVVMAEGCGAQALDIVGFADALRVELVQKGVHSVDVAEPDVPIPVDRSLLVLRIEAAPCEGSARILMLEFKDAGNSTSISPTLVIKDVHPNVRPRAAALFVAERLRATWPVLSALPAEATSESLEPATPHPSPVVALHAPLESSPEGEHPSRIEAREPGSTATSTPLPSAPRASTKVAAGVAVATALDWRLFSGPASAALLGPRVLVLSPRLRAVPLRLHFDVGAAFGGVHDSLGDISLSMVSGGLGVAIVGSPGPIRLEIGPKLELGWAAARGIPGSGTVSGSTANAVLATASIFAMASTFLARDWQGLLTIDVGTALAGLDARADGRPVAEVRGAMLGAQIGVGRTF